MRAKYWWWNWDPFLTSRALLEKQDSTCQLLGPAPGPSPWASARVPSSFAETKNAIAFHRLCPSHEAAKDPNGRFSALDFNVGRRAGVMAAPLSITDHNGEQLLAGLIWMRSPRIAVPARRSPKLELKCMSRRARVHPNHASEGNGSLLIALGWGLALRGDADGADAKGRWIFLADLSTSEKTRIWVAAADISYAEGRAEVRPLYGAERFFDAQKDLALTLFEMRRLRSYSGIAVADMSSYIGACAPTGDALPIDEVLAASADPGVDVKIRIVEPIADGTPRFREQPALTRYPVSLERGT